ncbi:MAG: TetR/AcrR family transcriptional regulator C-terminal domain-containing protein [Actinomycetota bacterium]
MTTKTNTRERLTRGRVIEAALRVLDAEGLEAVTMRRVAREVGVEAMSLYNHVKDKDDLLDGIVGRILLEFPVPATDHARDWPGYGREVANGWRAVLMAHPHALPLVGSRAPASDDPDVLLPIETALRALREAGLSEQDAVMAFHAIGGYIFGFVMMESGQALGMPGSDHKLAGFSFELPADRLPCLTACMPYLIACDFEEQFAFGLDLMIEGLRARTSVPAP